MRPIEPPSRLERQREITAILDKADLKEQHFFPLMLKMLWNVGPLNCFLGVKWAPGLCILVGLFCWRSVLSDSVYQKVDVCLQMSMFIQPLVLTGISLAACVIEKHRGVWEMRAVCRYNDKYLLAFRMLLMGIIGMLSVGLTAFSIRQVESETLLKIFLASSASYWLCGAVLMAALRFLPEKWFWPVAVCWYGLGLCMLVNSTNVNMVSWMNSAPLAILLIAALATASFYFWQTRQMALSRTNEKMGGYWKC